MIKIKKNLISTLMILFLLTLAVVAQQPAAPVQVQPAPVTTAITPQQTPVRIITPNTPTPSVHLTTPAAVAAPTTGAVTIAPVQSTPTVHNQTPAPAHSTPVTVAPTLSVPAARMPVVSSTPTPQAAATTIAPVASTTPAVAGIHDQSAQSGQNVTTTQAPAAKEPDYVTDKFATKIIEVKNASPMTLVSTLSILGSGFRGSKLTYDEGRKLIVVRDFPENIATIEDAVKRLDVPTPPKQDVELMLRVLIASNIDGVTSDITPDLRDVVKQLQSTFNYKSYSLISSVVQRVKDGNSSKGDGTIQVNMPLAKDVTDVPYSFFVQRVVIAKPTGATAAFDLNRFEYALNPQSLGHITDRVGKAVISSEFSIREGEKVVVGTASLKDKALILVISARVIK